jgi:hypothetical protein
MPLVIGPGGARGQPSSWLWIPEDDGPAASGAAAGSGRTGSSIVAADYQT